MMGSREQLEIVFNLDALPATAALQMLVDMIHKFGLPDKLERDSRGVRYKTLLKEAENRKSFTMFDAGGLSYNYGWVPLWEHAFIHLEEKEEGAAKNWDEWVAPFLKVPGFVQAWVSDVDFYHWQNTRDIWIYESEGRDYTGLPLISDGRSPPYEGMLIDTSGNPGRRTIQKGYVEAVGLRMWLSQTFWERIGGKAPKERLLAAGWTVTETDEKITRIETDCLHEGISAERQTALRSAIYGSEAEAKKRREMSERERGTKKEQILSSVHGDSNLAEYIEKSLRDGYGKSWLVYTHKSGKITVALIGKDEKIIPDSIVESKIPGNKK